METVGFQLQDFDERRFKSFDFSRSGLVLGIFIDIPKQLWYFVDQKRRKWAIALEEILDRGKVRPNWREFEELMGRLEYLALIMPELALRTARVRSILTDPENEEGYLRGAEEHKLPPHYLAKLREVEDNGYRGDVSLSMDLRQISSIPD